jgi:serine/threonine protein kinase
MSGIVTVEANLGKLEVGTVTNTGFVINIFPVTIERNRSSSDASPAPAIQTDDESGPDPRAIHQSGFASPQDANQMEQILGKLRAVVSRSADGEYYIPRSNTSGILHWQSDPVTIRSQFGKPTRSKDGDGITRTNYKKGNTTFSLFQLPLESESNKLPTETLFKYKDWLFLDIGHAGSATEMYAVAPADQNAVSDALPESMRKIITDENRVYYLAWPPELLGNGTYGVVFRAYDESHDYALKVLYERQFATRTGLMSINRTKLDALRRGDPQPLVPLAEDKLSPTHFLDFMDAILDGAAASLQQSAGKDKKAFERIRDEARTLIEQSEATTNLAERRYEEERSVSRSISAAMRRRRQLNPGDGIESRGLVPTNFVAVVGATQDFKNKKSTAYGALSNFLSAASEKEGKNLSRFALVLEYCTCTLKDLLEQEWYCATDNDGFTIKPVPTQSRFALDKTNASPTAAIAPSPRYIGYQILSNLSYAHRASAILPFLIGVARGLVTLHSAEKMHHDIKPGNVFIQLSDQSVTTLLGDFSFVAQAADEGTTEAVLRDVINTGSAHFRSPEQRDFSEVYQAYIIHRAGPRQRFALRVSDPKFRRSLITPHDKLVFSSDQEGTLYTVESSQGSDNAWLIFLTKDDETMRRDFLEQAAPTQIAIYKMPTMASDIFGFGALTFDLMSGGSSAERFYEVLRTVDYEGSKYNVATIMELYRRLVKNASIESNHEALREVFQRLSIELPPRPGVEFDACPEALFSIIIRCMTFKLDGSLSRSLRYDTLPSKQSPFAGLLADLEAIRGPFNETDSANNILIKPKASPLWPQLESHINPAKVTSRAS